MINIVKKERFLSAEFNCKHCGDTGKIKIYRDDWEEFEEIVCENCNSDWKSLLITKLFQILKLDHGQLLITGHLASDSVGINPFLNRLEEKGIQITAIGGLIR